MVALSFVVTCSNPMPFFQLDILIPMLFFSLQTKERAKNTNCPSGPTLAHSLPLDMAYCAPPFYLLSILSDIDCCRAPPLNLPC